MNGLRFPWSWLAWGATLALMACTPPSPPASPASEAAAPSARAPVEAAGGMPAAAGACDASHIQGVVGQVASPERAEAARQQAGARTVRVIGHDEIVTKEFNASRLNLHLDTQGRVARVYCG